MQVLWAATTLLTTPRNFGCRAGRLTLPALVVYVFMQTNSSAAPVRITLQMGLSVWRTKLETQQVKDELVSGLVVFTRPGPFKQVLITSL